MSRIKVLIVSLLALCAVGSVAAATASAELQGPWWRHPEAKGSQKQVKWPENEEQAIKATNAGLGNFKLRGKLIGEKVLIECTTVTGKGWLWNGLHQGENEGEPVNFTGCTAASVLIGKCVAEVEPVHAYSELMWKYRGESKELKEAGGQQKIYDAFGVAENKAGKFIFTLIKIPAPCAVTGEFPVEAAGTEQTFLDQHQGEHKIRWGTAPLVEPQNQDAKQGFLNWIIPNQTKLHHQEKEVIAKLEFGGAPAELEGKLAVELNSEEPFGAYNE